RYPAACKRSRFAPLGDAPAVEDQVECPSHYAAPSSQRKSNMVGMLLSFLILTLSAGSASWAQSAPPESDDSRYTFNQVDGGYLRLDGRTGQVAICTPRAVGWACHAVADERTAVETEIARLQAENVALKKELLAHNLALPGTVKPGEPTLKPGEPSRLQ